MMYYSLMFFFLCPMDMASLKSLLSKCVGVHEFGKLFTASTVLPHLFTMIFSSLSNLIYEATLDSFPGAVFVVSASTEYGCMVLTLILLHFVKRHERIYGELGRKQNIHLGRA